jgi:16S rRNA (cytosine967-C5)-methyltransferase
MTVSVARTIAFDVLLRVESQSAYASEVLHAALAPGVKSADAALATEISLGVLRWRRFLDCLLDRQLKKPVARLDLPVAIALRIGLYQLRFLGKIPARAAVNESVELVKRARKSSAASIVNAVLRRSAEEVESPAEKLMPPNLPTAERLGILHSHPTWLVERWLAHLREPAVVALLEANNCPPRLAFALHDSAHRDEILRGLESAGLRIDPGRLLKDSFSASGGSLARTGAFRSGQISIQDEASQTVPLLLGVRSGDRVLDLCAAPGGKTVVLARAAGPQGLVIAGELHEHRLRAMNAQFARLGLATILPAQGTGHDEEAKSARDGRLFGDRSFGSGSMVGALSGASAAEDGSAVCDLPLRHQTGSHVLLVALDATQPLPFAGRFHRILVDAPCSGTGTLARHPEIRWRLRPEHLAGFHALQTKLLRNALAQLAPGGRVVYSTCSIEPEENESVIAETLVSKSCRLVPASESERLLAPHLAPAMAASALFDVRAFFRTSPAVHATDGFFAAVLEKSH